MEKHYIGVDLGGTKILAGVFDTDYHCLATEKTKTKPEEGYDVVCGRIVKTVRAAAELAGIDPAKASGLQLLIEMAHFSPTADEVAVSLDGSLLGPPAIRNQAAENPDNPADVDENSWLVWDLEAAQVSPGGHEIKVVLVKRDPRIRPPLGVENVEFWVTYGS